MTSQRFNELNQKFDQLVEIEQAKAEKAFIATHGKCPKVRANAPDWCWDKANEDYMKWCIEFDEEMHHARMKVWDTPTGEELLKLQTRRDLRGVPEKVETHTEGIVEVAEFSDGSKTERWDRENDKEAFNYFYH